MLPKSKLDIFSNFQISSCKLLKNKYQHLKARKKTFFVRVTLGDFKLDAPCKTLSFTPGVQSETIINGETYHQLAARVVSCKSDVQQLSVIVRFD